MSDLSWVYHLTDHFEHRTIVNNNFAALNTDKVESTNPVFDNTEGTGMKLNPSDPQFGWVDIHGLIRPDPLGANAPTLAAFIGGNVREYAYTASDKIDTVFHIPHHYPPDSDMFIHIHWAHNGTAISGDLVVTLSYTYAKGHNQANFATEKSQTISYTTTDITTTPRYRHRVDEVQLTDVGGTGNYIDSGIIEPDGMFLLNMTVTTIPTITGGSPNEPFIFLSDIHAKSTNLPTKNKSPDFWA